MLKFANNQLIVCKVCRLVFNGREYADHQRNCKPVPRKVIKEAQYHYECNLYGEKFSAMLKFRKHQNSHVPGHRYLVHILDGTDRVEQLDGTGN